jgi:hypothetical protein
VGEAAGARVEVAGAHRARAREVPGGGVSCDRWRRGVIGHGVMVTAPPLARLWSWPAPLLPTGACCSARTVPPRARWASPAVSGTAARRSRSAGRIHDEGTVVLLDHRRRRVVDRGHQPVGNSARGLRTTEGCLAAMREVDPSCRTSRCATWPSSAGRLRGITHAADQRNTQRKRGRGGMAGLKSPVGEESERSVRRAGHHSKAP